MISLSLSTHIENPVLLQADNTPFICGPTLCQPLGWSKVHLGACQSAGACVGGGVAHHTQRPGKNSALSDIPIS